MSELALNSSETRVARPPSGGRRARPLVLSAIAAAALAGVAFAASSVIGDLVAAPAKSLSDPSAPPSIGQGLASSWPDLKDGLPSVAGASTIPGKAVATEARSPVEPTRIAALAAQPPSAIPGLSAPAVPATLSRPQATARPAPEPPAKRIPVPTAVAVVPPPPPAKLVAPARTAVPLTPRETVAARDETPKPPAQSVAKPREESPPVRKAVAEKRAPAPPVATVQTADRTHKAVASIKPAATPAVAKPTAAASKPTAGASKPTAVASASDAEETDILGVKLPSLAPAGRKIQEGVSALGDAVRSVF